MDKFTKNNNFVPNVFGMGLNDADYCTHGKIKTGKRGIICPIFRKWSNMMLRCYQDPTFKNNPTYRDVEVCQEWLVFSKFRSWMLSQDYLGSEGEVLYLDKDLIGTGQLYSPENCCFIDNQTNVFIRGKFNKSLARGVCISKDHNTLDNNFLVYITNPVTQKRLHICYANTVEHGTKVHDAYLSFFSSCLATRYKGVVKQKLEEFVFTDTQEVTAQLLYIQEKVLDFNNNFGNKVTDTDLIPLYVELCNEELNGPYELLSSYRDEDPVGCLDGICDFLFTSIMLLNLKGCGYVKGELLRKVTDIKTITTHDLRLLNLALESDNMSYLKSLVISVVNKFNNIYDINGAFNRVYDSNMSKMLKMGSSVNVNKEINAIEEEGRYTGVHCKELNNHLVFLAKEDTQTGVVFSPPKIVKPISYKSPEDLGGLEEFIR